MEIFGEKVVRFLQQLHFTGALPENIQILNPYRDNPEIKKIAERFYTRFYGDTRFRRMLIGINPGRLGAGVTGIPFTDSKRLTGECGIPVESVATHEPSSVFMYDMIRAYGGVKQFYRDFYIGSVSPLGLIIRNEKGNWVNRNYYDDNSVFRLMYDFIIQSMHTQLEFGINREVGYVLGKKNYTFFREINEKEKFFKTLTVLEHPRYIVQYKPHNADWYIAKYLDAFGGE
ncbi:MAG: SMUG2 DNA glycosylase family protein [Tannerellaceae bacterium]|nr:SMUG2 DNA glycosylase family protein [Tannerellaceae bacterium]